jgi:hypothetical protein
MISLIEDITWHVAVNADVIIPLLVTYRPRPPPSLLVQHERGALNLELWKQLPCSRQGVQAGWDQRWDEVTMMKSCRCHHAVDAGCSTRSGRPPP